MTDPKRIRRSEQPIGRITRICGSMADAFESHPDKRDDDRCIILVLNDSSGEGGNALVGFGAPGETDAHEVTDAIILHLRAVCQMHGLDVTVTTHAMN